MTVVRSGTASDTGRVRSVNQDLALRTPNLFAVADGMGGHVGGEVAARVAVEALRVAFGRQSSTGALERAVAEANAAVWSQSQDRADLRGMGTTLTAAALVVGGDGRDMVALANVGDSRAYLYTAGRLTRITVDHSLAEEKVLYGELTEAEAAVHPHRHILTRALGVSPNVEADLWELHLRTGDRLLLCSDGLTNEVPEPRIAEVLATVPDPTVVAQQLVRAANDHGGNDNITVLVVDVLVGDDEVATTDVIDPRPASVGRGAPAVAAAGLASGLGGTPAGAVVVEPDRDLTGVTPSVTRGAEPVGTAPGPPAARTEAGPTEAGPTQAGPTDAGPTEAGRPAVGGSAPAPNGAAPAPGGAIAARVRPPSVRPETRAERRRRLGVPRRITFRVVGFLLLLAAVVAAGYFLVRWYATDNWYVTTQNGQLVVYQGRPGGVLGFEPKVVDRTGVKASDVLAIHLPSLRSGVQEPSLKAARRYVATLQQEFFAQQLINHPPTTIPPPTTAPPPTTTTTTTAPPTTAPPPTTAAPVTPTT